VRGEEPAAAVGGLRAAAELRAVPGVAVHRWPLPPAPPFDRAAALATAGEADVGRAEVGVATDRFLTGVAAGPAPPEAESAEATLPPPTREGVLGRGDATPTAREGVPGREAEAPTREGVLGREGAEAKLGPTCCPDDRLAKAPGGSCAAEGDGMGTGEAARLLSVKKSSSSIGSAILEASMAAALRALSAKLSKATLSAPGQLSAVPTAAAEAARAAAADPLAEAPEAPEMLAGRFAGLGVRWPVMKLSKDTGAVPPPTGSLPVGVVLPPPAQAPEGGVSCGLLLPPAVPGAGLRGLWEACLLAASSHNRSPGGPLLLRRAIRSVPGAIWGRKLHSRCSSSNRWFWPSTIRLLRRSSQRCRSSCRRSTRCPSDVIVG